MIFFPSISDCERCLEMRARDKQVMKKIMANSAVALVSMALVLVPKIDSAPEKVSDKPPPLPA